MGYFSSGTEGLMYEEKYCARCVHQDGPDEKSDCTIWLLHLMNNYDECDNDKSFLHTLIPRSSDGLGNEQCTLFFEKSAQLSMFEKDAVL